MPLKQTLQLLFVKKFGIKPSENCSVEYLEVSDFYFSIIILTIGISKGLIIANY